MTKGTLTLNTPDNTGYTPNLDLIGKLLRHRGNGKIYSISGFCWIGELDEWGYTHAEVREDGLPGVTIVRPMNHITGFRSNGDSRYDPV